MIAILAMVLFSVPYGYADLPSEESTVLWGAGMCFSDDPNAYQDQLEGSQE